MKPRGTVCLLCQRERQLKRQRQQYARMSAEQRRAKNQRQAQQRRASPTARAKHNEGSRRWRQQYPDRAAASSKRWRDKVMSDPKRAEEWREYQRIYHRIWRQRKGINVRPPSPEAYANGHGAAVPRGSVPCAVLAPVIRSWLGDLAGRQLGNSDYKERRHSEDYGAGQEQLAELSGVSDRTIREILAGTRVDVQLLTADRLCGTLGLPLGMLYPEAM